MKKTDLTLAAIAMTLAGVTGVARALHAETEGEGSRYKCEACIIPEACHQGSGGSGWKCVPGAITDICINPQGGGCTPP